MGKKELLKQLIAGFQALLPIEVYPRELTLPLDSGKIITYRRLCNCKFPYDSSVRLTRTFFRKYFLLKLQY